MSVIGEQIIDHSDTKSARCTDFFAKILLISQ